HAIGPAVFLLPVDRTDAASLGSHADLGPFAHLDLGDHPARRRVPTDEGDAGDLADDTAPSVAPDEVLGSKRPTGQLDIDATLVLREALYFATAHDRHAEL